MAQEQELRPGSLCVWAGEIGPHEGRATQVPVVHSVTFGYDELDEWLEVARGEKPGHIYSRNTNPTVEAFEEKVRVLEGADAATSFATGMAAISDTLLALLSPGDRVVSITDTYGGTSKLFLQLLPRMGIEVSLCETGDQPALKAAIADGCSVVYLETPTNPTLKVVDLPRSIEVAHRNEANVIVDNTFATPLNQRPLTLGADLVVHSATKFLGGHADALGGILCGRSELVQRVFGYREITGAALSPLAAYLLLRGMKTLHLRIARQNETALFLARHLQAHPRVEAVFYPGLETHPGHDVARTQMLGFGGVLSFSISGGMPALGQLLSGLRLAHRAANLGAVETTVGPPATTSHVELTTQERRRLGIPEALIRYSVGIEDPDDLREDLDRALASLEL